MHNEFTAVIERDGDWFVGYCPEIPGANGQGRTVEDCRRNLVSAVSLILEDRREELSNELRRQIHDVRAIGPADLAQGVVDAEEASVSDIQKDIEIALMQMKSETLNRVNEALGRLEAGSYGFCYECGDEIAGARLRALPFALRCKDCEEEREQAEARDKFYARRGTTAAILDIAS